MANRSSFTSCLTIAAAMLAAGSGIAAQHEAAGSALERFEHSVSEYAALHRAMERHLPALEISPEAQTIHQAVELRASAIRRARAGAKVGDIFAPDVREAFRSRIRQALDARGDATADLLSEMYEEGEGWEQPVVNGRFSWRTAVATPACVLATLPALPEELQYRFVGLDLVLVDIDANLIVDVLPDALDSAPRSRS